MGDLDGQAGISVGLQGTAITHQGVNGSRPSLVGEWDIDEENAVTFVARGQCVASIDRESFFCIPFHSTLGYRYDDNLRIEGGVLNLFVERPVRDGTKILGGEASFSNFLDAGLFSPSVSLWGGVVARTPWSPEEGTPTISLEEPVAGVSIASGDPDIVYLSGSFEEVFNPEEGPLQHRVGARIVSNPFQGPVHLSGNANVVVSPEEPLSYNIVAVAAVVFPEAFDASLKYERREQENDESLNLTVGVQPTSGLTLFASGQVGNLTTNNPVGPIGASIGGQVEFSGVRVVVEPFYLTDPNFPSHNFGGNGSVEYFGNETVTAGLFGYIAHRDVSPLSIHEGIEGAAGAEIRLQLFGGLSVRAEGGYTDTVLAGSGGFGKVSVSYDYDSTETPAVTGLGTLPTPFSSYNRRILAFNFSSKALHDFMVGEKGIEIPHDQHTDDFSCETCHSPTGTVQISSEPISDQKRTDGEGCFGCHTADTGPDKIIPIPSSDYPKIHPHKMEGCPDCHGNMQQKDSVLAKPKGEVLGLCLQCHGMTPPDSHAMISWKNNHGKTVTETCNVCHPKTGSSNQKAPSCFGCHEDHNHGPLWVVQHANPARLNPDSCSTAGCHDADQSFCQSCHTAHDTIRKDIHKQSALVSNASRIQAECKKCHPTGTKGGS
ncbi:MAG: cytochrome c3 family protein [bacterium]|nr:cytochrome c3 family protein [bacterium]